VMFVCLSFSLLICPCVSLSVRLSVRLSVSLLVCVCLCVQPSEVKTEDLDGTAMDDVDGIPLEELDGMPLDAEPVKDMATTAAAADDDDINGVPLKSIVPYGDDIDGEPGITAICHCFINPQCLLVIRFSLQCAIVCQWSVLQ